MTVLAFVRIRLSVWRVSKKCDTSLVQKSYHRLSRTAGKMKFKYCGRFVFGNVLAFVQALPSNSISLARTHIRSFIFR